MFYSEIVTLAQHLPQKEDWYGLLISGRPGKWQKNKSAFGIKSVEEGQGEKEHLGSGEDVQEGVSKLCG